MVYNELRDWSIYLPKQKNLPQSGRVKLSLYVVAISSLIDPGTRHSLTIGHQ